MNNLNFDQLFKKYDYVVFFDTETTGLDPECSYITELAAIKVVKEEEQGWVAYAVVVRFNASKNDPEKIIWNRIVKYVSSHPTEFFDQWGDWKKDLIISDDKIKKMGE